jgi:hypothetical protein
MLPPKYVHKNHEWHHAKETFDEKLNRVRKAEGTPDFFLKLFTLNDKKVIN